jgi:L-alanine-DL-glutamate epimerase-like enolase superfamily enzyme
VRATVIDGLDVSVYVVPTEEPESDGTFTWTSTTVVVAEPVANGTRGLGFTYSTPAAGAVIEDVLRAAVLGGDAMDVVRLWSRMVDSVRNIGRPGVASAAIAAVDIALWDLKAKLLALPLAQLLGPMRDAVPVYGSGGFTSYTQTELIDQLTGWSKDLAIPRVKMKIGTNWGRDERRDLERVTAAREALGPEVDLYVDANGAYSVKQALRLAEPFADLGVAWFEEPVSSDDLQGLRRIRDRAPIEIAAGEYGSDLAYFDKMLAAGAVDVLQADVSRCAGITEWLRVAALCAGHGSDISGHCAQSLHLHPALCVPNLRHLEYFHDHHRVDRILFDGVIEPHAGELRPDWSSPGLGLDVNLERAASYRWRGGVEAPLGKDGFHS